MSKVYPPFDREEPYHHGRSVENSVILNYIFALFIKIFLSILDEMPRSVEESTFLAPPMFEAHLPADEKVAKRYGKRLFICQSNDVRAYQEGKHGFVVSKIGAVKPTR